MYVVESHVLNEPLFTYVHTTYVLTLASQPERKAAMLERLRKFPLTSVVRFIVNPGTEAKGLGMNTCDDLLHANKFACRMALADGRPAIFLEDDCEFTSGMTALWAKAAEERILHIDAISFGAFMGVSVSTHRDWIRVIRGGVTHGMLLSHGGMSIVLGLPYTGHAHDSPFYALARIDAPRWPVGVQRHYRTKNSITYDESGLVTFLLTSVFKSSSDPLPVYIYSHTVGSIGGLYVVVAFVVAAVTLCILPFTR